MIKLVNLCKYYRVGQGVKTVLNNVNAHIKPGRNLGILGQNGAGKSSLLRLIGGAELPTSGHICRHGRVSWPIGFSGGFHGSLSGRENLRFICRIYDACINEITEFVEDFSELGAYMDMPVNTYSSGMKAKLAFGLSMAINFDYYLIDEITAVGDANFKKKSKAEFERRKDHSTLLVVSHSISTIREHCDIAAVLHKGDLLFYDDMEEAITFYQALPATKH
ncbi:ABC transporter ATP-binding protein [Desulfobulbus rhabdoformis]|uniref:ABC transporter ATP-binding protein n=1 Tax=Desulfobulbus rhabdoformis TaxID=34032 RepID=UPI0019652EAE|nr:ABC transporter ATP-binding protein [Desulfobulbus rhabdoformis]MBM9613662.1 ABC transporter ATP-binding protein [Desulfobulbus rhabdoformis]